LQALDLRIGTGKLPGALETWKRSRRLAHERLEVFFAQAGQVVHAPDALLPQAGNGMAAADTQLSLQEPVRNLARSIGCFQDQRHEIVARQVVAVVDPDFFQSKLIVGVYAFDHLQRQIPNGRIG
jgi:hypothetical protein